MKTSFASLAALTVACAFAAALFGFGADVFAFRSVYEELGREVLIQAMRSAVYITLGVVLVFRGGWWGVLAAVAMALCATTAERLLFPFAFDWAAVGDPHGYAKEFGDVGRPSAGNWSTSWDVMLVGISAALARGLIIMAHANPASPRDG